MTTSGMAVAQATCDVCGRRDLTVVAAVPADRLYKAPPPPPPPTPAQEACGKWIEDYAGARRSLNYADESITLQELPNIIQRSMVRAFHAGWEAREKIADEEKEQLRSEISEQAERREFPE